MIFFSNSDSSAHQGPFEVFFAPKHCHSILKKAYCIARFFKFWTLLGTRTFESFWCFDHFQIRAYFFQKKIIYFVEKPTGKQIPLLNCFKNLTSKIVLKLSEIWQKKFRFDFFGVKLRHISIEIHLLKEPTRQWIQLLLNGSKVLIHKIFRKFDKKCIKVESFWNFCSFWDEFGVNQKVEKSLQILIAWDYIHVSGILLVKPSNLGLNLEHGKFWKERSILLQKKETLRRQ